MSVRNIDFQRSAISAHPERFLHRNAMHLDGLQLWTQFFFEVHQEKCKMNVQQHIKNTCTFICRVWMFFALGVLRFVVDSMEKFPFVVLKMFTLYIQNPCQMFTRKLIEFKEWVGSGVCLEEFVEALCVWGVSRVWWRRNLVDGGFSGWQV